MLKNLSERSLLVTLYLTLLFGSGLVPKQAHPSLPTQSDVNCKPVKVQSIS
jgi:hypothetical protein